MTRWWTSNESYLFNFEFFKGKTTTKEGAAKSNHPQKQNKTSKHKGNSEQN